MMIPRPSILIVDDDPHITDSVRLLTEGEGYKVQTSANGIEAMELLRSEDFDIVLLDMVLSDRNGLEVLDFIKEKGLNTLVIVMTGYPSIDAAVNCLREGAYDFIKKPFEQEELLKRIENALHKKRLDVERIDRENAYYSLVENSLQGFVLIQDGGIVFVNKVFAATFGYTVPELRAFSPEELLDRIHSKDRQIVLERIDDCFSGINSTARSVIRGLRKNGEECWAEAIINRITYRGKSAVQITEIDITKRKQAQEEIRKSEERYRNIFQNAFVSIWEEDFSEVRASIDELKENGVTDFRKYLDDHPEFVGKAAKMAKVINVNDATVKLYGATTKEQLLGPLENIFLSKTPHVFKEELIAIAEGKRYVESETVGQTLSGEWLDMLIYLTIPLEKEKFKNMLVNVIDISERKCAERELLESEKRFRCLSEASFESVLIHEDGAIIDVNRTFSEMYGYERKEAIGMEVLDTVPVQLRDSIEKKVFLKYGKPWESLGLKKDGTTFPCEIRVRSIPYHGRMIKVAVISDITERKNREEQLENALRERETLLKEIHHRVKNNMQIVSSLLDLQERRIDNRNAKQIFQDCRDRVGAMALVHETLYKSDALAEIKLEEFIPTLLRNLSHLYNNKSKINLKMDIESISLGIDQAMPFCLAINELLSNSFKHAFPGKSGGSIEIKLRNAGKSDIELSVKDNGRGFTRSIDFRNSKTLGFKLVGGLVEGQLGATWSTNTKNGTEHVIRFRRINREIFHG